MTTIDDVLNSYDFDEYVTEKVFQMAYDYGHSAGAEEVKMYCREFGDFAEDIINHIKG